MAGTNPFARRVAQQQELPLVEEAIKDAVIDSIQPPRPSAFQLLVSKMFGGHGGVALATTMSPKPMSKRRARRLRGKEKETRRIA